MVHLPQKCPACGRENYHYGRCPCQSDTLRDPMPDPKLTVVTPGTKTLRDRCKDMVGTMQRNAMLRQGSPVDDLIAFVQSEIGRTADASLEDTKPMILYFCNEQDRAEFIALVRDAKPGMVAKTIP